MDKNYIYFLLDQRKPGHFTFPGLNFSFLFSPFYVGKGQKNRYAAHFRSPSLLNKNSHKNNTIRRIKADFNEDPKILFYKNSLSESEANQLEKYMIEKIGRATLGLGPLTNITSGGDGGDTLSQNPNLLEIKKKLSKSLSGSKNPMFGIHRFREKNPFYGKTHSKETRVIISLANKNKIMSPDAIEKIKKYQTGRKKSDIHKKRISLAHQGKIISEQTKEKFSHNQEKYHLYEIISPNGEYSIINNLSDCSHD